MNPHYINLAYERTVITHLRRYLEEKFLEGGGGVKDELVCESVPYDVRIVPNGSVVDVIQRLQEEEKRLTDEMSQFEFRKRDVQPLAKKSQPREEVPQPAAPAPRPRGKAGKARDRSGDPG